MWEKTPKLGILVVTFPVSVHMSVPGWHFLEPFICITWEIFSPLTLSSLSLEQLYCGFDGYLVSASFSFQWCKLLQLLNIQEQNVIFFQLSKRCWLI